MVDRVINHSSHWRSWKQVDQFVECEKCDVLLYEGDAPNNTKRILMEVLSRENTDMPVLDERADMPNTTNQPPFRVVDPPTHDDNYESDPNHDSDYREGEVTPVAINGQTVAAQSASKDIGSSEVNVMQAFVEITSTFSRTIADPGNDRFGSVTAGLSVKEMFPGEMSAMDIANIAEGHYIITKEKVLSQLQLPFEQDQATGMILEAFPGARTISSTPAVVAPEAAPPVEDGRQAPAQPPAARFGSSAPTQRQQASSGPRSAPSGQWEPAPSQAEMKRELLEYPDLWYPDPQKTKADTKPDFISCHYTNKSGYPAGLWIEGSRGPNFTDDELDTLNTMTPEDFCQTRPRAPR
jgi:hypothetical protein